MTGRFDVPAIDIHAHVVFPEVFGLCGDAGPEMGTLPDGAPFFRSGDALLRNVRYAGTPFFEVDLRLERMDKLRIDHQVLSPNPLTFFYRRPIEEALEFNRRTNDVMAETVAKSSRFSGLAQLPMQDPDAAVAELRRAVEELGLKGSFVGSDIAGRVISDPAFDPVWAEHERLGVPTIVHPATGMEEPIRPEHEAWEMPMIYGYLVDEGMSVAQLLFGGVLDRHPGLHAHIPHGGGFAPYQKGRLSEAVRKRPWGPSAVSRPFDELWAQLSFDTAVHNDDALAFLVGAEGPDRIMIGSNFAGWDQDDRTVTRIEELPVDDATKRAILGENAIRIFGLDL